jgi:hypothetical protein
MATSHHGLSFSLQYYPQNHHIFSGSNGDHDTTKKQTKSSATLTADSKVKAGIEKLNGREAGNDKGGAPMDI